MADIAARREARRRKILENSESRLLRISGQITKDDNTNNHETKCHKSNLTSSFTNINTNEIPSSESLVNSSWDDPLDFDNEITEANLRTNVGTKKRNFTKEFVYNDNGIIHGQHQTNYKTAEIYNDTRYSKQNNVSLNGNDEKNELSILTKILVNRSVYILLAAILNLMLILRAEHLFGTSIIVPFLLICLSRLWIIRRLNYNELKSTTNSMIFAALILCNVRPKIIYALKKLFNIVNQLINDLAIFIFSFVLIYYIISQYWIDFDISMANKVEIFVDRHATT
ncbi:hypothetical protein PV328_007377 [Microctonus aethiopoides]|uniref:Uncharacterized protein n=1 Tax=Microctonus aethiopoides TaxID=144406 RepID=A0AA39F0K5_9HYME|nr:hypothetical protein PV328_007377 [Microctonus aethiopoides]